MMACIYKLYNKEVKHHVHGFQTNFGSNKAKLNLT